MVKPRSWNWIGLVFMMSFEVVLQDKIVSHKFLVSHLNFYSINNTNILKYFDQSTTPPNKDCRKKPFQVRTRIFMEKAPKILKITRDWNTNHPNLTNF